jgi:hypothetical protein
VQSQSQTPYCSVDSPTHAPALSVTNRPHGQWGMIAESSHIADGSQFA